MSLLATTGSDEGFLDTEPHTGAQPEPEHGFLCAPVCGSVSRKPSSLPVVANNDTADAHGNTGPVVSIQQDQLLPDTMVEARRPVLKYIPKVSRLPAAEKLSTLLDRVVACPDNIVAWQQLL